MTYPDNPHQQVIYFIQSSHINTSEKTLLRAASFAVSSENLNFLSIHISHLLLCLFCLQLFFLQNYKCLCRELKKSQHCICA